MGDFFSGCSTTVIIGIVVTLLLVCCCCLMGAVALGWVCGDVVTGMATQCGF